MNTANKNSSGLPAVRSIAAAGTLPDDIPGAVLAEARAGECHAQPGAVRGFLADAGSEMNAPDPAKPSYAALIIAIRRQLALSQENLARQLGVSFATVNRWEKGAQYAVTARPGPTQRFLRTDGRGRQARAAGRIAPMKRTEGKRSCKHLPQASSRLSLARSAVARPGWGNRTRSSRR
jgi:DNA-binding XRE family transcriptional regulator